MDPLDSKVLCIRGFYLLSSQGNKVHQLQHFNHKEKSSKKIASGEGGAVVYSLSYHPRHPCLLSAGAQGSVKVWKGPEWNNEDEET